MVLRISYLQTATMEKDKAMEELSKVKEAEINISKEIEEDKINITKEIEEAKINISKEIEEDKIKISKEIEALTNQNNIQRETLTNTETVIKTSIQTVGIRKSSVSEESRSFTASQSSNSQIVTSSVNNLVSSHHEQMQATDVSVTLKDGTAEGEEVHVEVSDSLMFEGLKGAVSLRQLIEAKLLDVDTLNQLKSGQKTMADVQALLTVFTSKASAIAGVYSESSKKKISFMEASEKGFIAKTYAIEFLEAQAATGHIIDHITGETYSVQEALEKGVVEEELRDKLLDAEKAVTGYIHGSRTLSVFQAMESRILDRHKGKKIIEAQIATGGLIDPKSGIRVPLAIALEKGLLNKATLQSLYDPVSNPKGFHNPDTGQKAYYGELLKTCVYDVDGQVYLLPFGNRHLSSITLTRANRVSVISSSSGAEMSTFEAYRDKLINKNTYLLLSQQESTWEETTLADSGGGSLHILTDHRSGRQLCIEHGLKLKILTTVELENYRAGLLKINELADLLILRRTVLEDPHSPIAGLWDVCQKQRLSILKGYQQNLVDRLTLLRLLEAQVCTGGICDPALGDKVRVTEALQRGLVDETLARHLQQCEQAYYGIADPQTAKLLSVGQAMQRGLFPRDMGLRCLEFQALTGGLVNPETHSRITVEEAVSCNLIDDSTALQLKDEKNHSKSLTCPKTKRKISFKEALDKGVFDCHTGLKLLEATKPHSVGVQSFFHYIWTYPAYLK
ncbi:desmoplakin-like [Megalops cyprinoides]|uniref:desmoplakin-like n=1 Tax=Megalops cyprinoides TaxID=118141 RepID=UPI001863C32A|nr:desmoplakin-like [Megalops cyprinoides]